MAFPGRMNNTTKAHRHMACVELGAHMFGIRKQEGGIRLEGRVSPGCEEPEMLCEGIRLLFPGRGRGAVAYQRQFCQGEHLERLNL